MSKAKVVCSPIVGHFKLSSKQCPTSENDTKDMRKVPYVSIVSNLMYVMVCNRPDIANAVELLSSFFIILRKSTRKQ